MLIRFLSSLLFYHILNNATAATAMSAPTNSTSPTAPLPVQCSLLMEESACVGARTRGCAWQSTDVRCVRFKCTKRHFCTCAQPLRGCARDNLFPLYSPVSALEPVASSSPYYDCVYEWRNPAHPMRPWRQSSVVSNCTLSCTPASLARTNAALRNSHAQPADIAVSCVAMHGCARARVPWDSVGGRCFRTADNRWLTVTPGTDENGDFSRQSALNFVLYASPKACTLAGNILAFPSQLDVGGIVLDSDAKTMVSLAGGNVCHHHRAVPPSLVDALEVLSFSGSMSYFDRFQVVFEPATVADDGAAAFVVTYCKGMSLKYKNNDYCVDAALENGGCVGATETQGGEDSGVLGCGVGSGGKSGGGGASDGGGHHNEDGGDSDRWVTSPAGLVVVAGCGAVLLAVIVLCVIRRHCRRQFDHNNKRVVLLNGGIGDTFAAAPCPVVPS